MATSTKIRVRFAVEDEEHAEKISALLEALGYEAVREIDHGSTQSRLRWAVARLTNQANLTVRERDILGYVLQGRLNSEIGEELGIRKATVKWHMHNIFTKTGASTREALLREALQLGPSLLPQADAEDGGDPGEDADTSDGGDPSDEA